MAKYGVAGLFAACSLTVPLKEETSLSLGEFHGRRAFLVVVSHVVDPSAYGIALHQPSIVGLQQFGRRIYIPHSGIEPQIIAVGRKDDGHAVVDGSGHGIWRRGQDRAGLHRVAACVLPAIPYPREREQLIDFKTIRLLGFPRLLPFIEAICGD